MFKRRRSCRNYIIYYSGHAQAKTGNWIVDTNDCVKLQDILQLWDRRPISTEKDDQLLIIITDSCYSGVFSVLVWNPILNVLQPGCWVEKIEELLRKDVIVQASCDKHEKARCFTDGDGSLFTQCFTTNLFKKITHAAWIKSHKYEWIIENVKIFCSNRIKNFIFDLTKR